MEDSGQGLAVDPACCCVRAPSYIDVPVPLAPARKLATIAGPLLLMCQSSCENEEYREAYPEKLPPLRLVSESRCCLSESAAKKKSTEKITPQHCVDKVREDTKGMCGGEM